MPLSKSNTRESPLSEQILSAEAAVEESVAFIAIPIFCEASGSNVILLSVHRNGFYTRG